MQLDIGILIAFIIYFALMVWIGFYFYRKSNNISDYFLGGRSLGSWVTALSAQASDMSGWLLLGQGMTGREAFGCALVFAAVVLAQIPFSALRGRRAARKKSA